VQQVREQVADLREQAKGLLGKIADAITEFLKNPAKAIVDGLLRILGIPPPSFWALVDKLGDVISGIAADPKKFANTLMAGVGQGFQQFFHNLPVHLGQALFQWLFSKLGEAGVQMPADFSIKSILTLVLEIMGITWARIKTILAKHIGPQGAAILQAIEAIFDLWQEDGWCGYGDGFLWTIDPSMLAHIFAEGSEGVAFLRTAMGGVFYSKGQEVRYLDILAGDTSEVFNRMSSLFDTLLLDEDYVNDALRYDLFAEALPKLGRLDRTECYGFLPPLPMGGSESLDTLKRVKLREHLAIVIQALG
jgi:hypothetical protein